MWRHSIICGWPAGRRWRRRCWRWSTWAEPAWWLWGCAACRRSGSPTPGSARWAGRGGWRRTARSPTAETGQIIRREAQEQKCVCEGGWRSNGRNLNEADHHHAAAEEQNPEDVLREGGHQGELQWQDIVAAFRSSNTGHLLICLHKRGRDSYSLCTAEMLSASCRPETQKQKLTEEERKPAQRRKHVSFTGTETWNATLAG